MLAHTTTTLAVRRPVRRHSKPARRAPKLSTLDRIRADKRVEFVDDERNIGNSIIVTLRSGWAIEPDPVDGTHVFGGDTPTETLQLLRTVKPCACEQCRAALAKAVSRHV